jgi:hypothetical protein
VRLEPYGLDPVEVPLSVTIPEDAREGIIQVTVCDGARSQAMEQARVPGKFQPTDLDGLLELLEGQDRQTELVARVRLDRRGLTVRGEEVPSLPASVLSVMSSSPDTDSGAAGVDLKVKMETGWVVSGQMQLRIAVKREAPAGRAGDRR